MQHKDFISTWQEESCSVTMQHKGTSLSKKFWDTAENFARKKSFMSTKGRTSCFPPIFVTFPYVIIPWKVIYVFDKFLGSSCSCFLIFTFWPNSKLDFCHEKCTVLHSESPYIHIIRFNRSRIYLIKYGTDALPKATTNPLIPHISHEPPQIFWELSD